MESGEEVQDRLPKWPIVLGCLRAIAEWFLLVASAVASCTRRESDSFSSQW